MVGREGSGGTGPGTPVQPSTGQGEETDQQHEGAPLRTVHPPGTPMTREELERLKREAERPDRVPEKPTDEKE